MTRWIVWGLFTLVLATVVHFLVVTNASQYIMATAMARVGGGKTNVIAHGTRATSESRAIVKPSPDLLYSTCVYDVSKRPLKITTGAPADTYWSVAFYDENTDNFYVLNDTTAKGQATTIFLLGAGQSTPADAAPGAVAVSAPTAKGLVLFRTLVNDDAREAEIDQARRAAKCEPL